MTLMPYGAFFPDGWRKELERWMEDWPSVFGPGFRSLRVDVYETDEEVIVSCELPGLEKKEDLKIDVERLQVTIAGQFRRGQEIKREQYHRQERYMGEFHRTVPLPAPVKSEGVKASYRNGVLEIRLPKEHPGCRRTVEIDFE